MAFLLRRPLCPTNPSLARAFSGSPAALGGKHSKEALRDMLAGCPAYPYPIKHTFKQSWFGLYDGKHIQFGNNVPDGEYCHKTRRTWHPNVKQKKLYSKAMGRFIQMTVATSVLRTIDKVGGLDEYLLSIKPARLSTLGPFGWKLRHKLMQTPKIQQRFDQESVELGLKEAEPRPPRRRSKNAAAPTTEAKKPKQRAPEKELDVEGFLEGLKL